MSLKSNFPPIHLETLSTPRRHFAILRRRPLQPRDYREWKRRRLKFSRTPILTVSNQLGGPAPLDKIFQNLISQFPSVNSLDFIAPALGFASGVALYLSRFSPYPRISPVSEMGEWILFASPTPFNRFVMLRCSSISFKDNELLEGVNEKLVKDERHFVMSNSGSIQVREGGDWKIEENLVYQRGCVSTDDGGVISLDWPANLDLSEEHGLDTTLLLIPGTAEGSMDVNIRSFVSESLKHGCFPIVMNPRGCAGSPVTSARLFTAADSDDISTAIQFINKARPWTTLMGVGWGYGANMLTKYLAEVGEKTPLIAATCINNPFDLEEATRSSPYHIAIDRKLTDGLIDILQSNKELFHGRAKRFDVDKALSATSVRDFDKAISMVSYGFDAIEDFYAKSSTRGVIGNVKIPVLFIQNDDWTVPLFSVPRSLIAENPFTSLLLCSFSPTAAIKNCQSTIFWCHHLTLEWLTAVELGLLKGRHPLLKDVDVTFNPSKGLALVEGRGSNKSGGLNKLLNRPLSNSLNGHPIGPSPVIFDGSDTSTRIYPRFTQDSLKSFITEYDESPGEDDDTSRKNKPFCAELVKEEEVSSADTEMGKVLQSTEVVMNMLDVTMPGTLSEEQKKKVLSAVGQGETVMKALQDAVPEDVREKLTTAVSGILQKQGSTMKLDGLLGISQMPNMKSGLKSIVQEKAEGSLRQEYGNEVLSSDQVEIINESSGFSNRTQRSTEKPLNGGPESEPGAVESSQKSIDVDRLQSSNGHSGDKEPNEFGNNYENADVSSEKAAQSSEYVENGDKGEISIRPESEFGIEDGIIDQNKVKKDGGIGQLDMKEENIQQNEEKIVESSDQNMMSSSKTEERVVTLKSSSENQLTEKESIDNQKIEEKSILLSSNQNGYNPSTFNVTQALDALTGIDDSTQVAVNSVFHVIEDMLSHLEGRENEIDVKDSETVEHHQAHSVRVNDQFIENKLVKKEPDQKDMSLIYDDTDIHPSCPGAGLDNDLSGRRNVEKFSDYPILPHGDSKLHESEKSNNIHVENKKQKHLMERKIATENPDELRYPLYITSYPYGDPLYKECFRNYFISKMDSMKSLDLDKNTALFLDYIPEEGQWKLLEQSADAQVSDHDITSHANRKVSENFLSEAVYTGKMIEPSYVILDSMKQEESVVGDDVIKKAIGNVEIEDDKSKAMLLVKSIILDSLKVEVCRRLGVAGMEEIESDLARDLGYVAHMVSVAVGYDKEHVLILEGKDPYSEKFGTLNGPHIISAISSSVQATSYLRRVLPVGVIVGSILAALRKFFNVASVTDNGHTESSILIPASDSAGRSHFQYGEKQTDRLSADKIDQREGLAGSVEIFDKSNLTNPHTVVVGAVTAALGASALLVHEQDSYEENESVESSPKLSEEKDKNHLEPGKLEEMPGKNQHNIVTSLAEKALSVAAPVVPTKDGEVDQERLVKMLAELGQKGGILKLVGKIALLWGGIRGAMSLTDKLISFLRIAERSLFQRVLGFVCMVLVLWSPVVVPLFPTLVQNWTNNNSSRIAEAACIIGLYTAVMILIVMWGKRIRGYEDPLEQYGLDVTSLPKIQNFLKGLIGGVVFVLLVESINASLGYVSLSWPSTLPSTSCDAVTWFKVFWKMVLLVGRTLVTATGIALVEGLLFLSWFPGEIAADFGYHRGIIISGIAFSLFQRSPWAIPGLWLLSLALAGARQRSEGDLSLPIGLRTGILSSSYILKMGGFLTHLPGFPPWLSGTPPLQPFDSIVGLVFSLCLAILLYPRQPLQSRKITTSVGE